MLEQITCLNLEKSKAVWPPREAGYCSLAFHKLFSNLSISCHPNFLPFAGHLAEIGKLQTSEIHAWSLLPNDGIILDRKDLWHSYTSEEAHSRCRVKFKDSLWKQNKNKQTINKTRAAQELPPHPLKQTLRVGHGLCKWLPFSFLLITSL